MTASSVGVFALLINSTLTAKNIVFNAIVSDAGLMQSHLFQYNSQFTPSI